MTTVQDCIRCPQCGYDGADTGFDCDTDEEDTRCRKCGYSEDWERKESSDGEVKYEHRITEGAGVLFFRAKGVSTHEVHYFATQDGVTESAAWLREKLASGAVHPGTAYVSRWNAEARAVEFVIGRFYEYGSYDPDDEIPEQMGPSDLRPFTLVKKRYHVRLHYCCDHILDAWTFCSKDSPSRQWVWCSRLHFRVLPALKSTPTRTRLVIPENRPVHEGSAARDCGKIAGSMVRAAMLIRRSTIQKTWKRQRHCSTQHTLTANGGTLRVVNSNSRSAVRLTKTLLPTNGPECAPFWATRCHLGGDAEVGSHAERDGFRPRILRFA